MIMLSAEDVNKLIAKASSEGIDTGTTYELVGEVISIKSMTTDNVRMIVEVDEDFHRNFLRALILRPSKGEQVGSFDDVYDMSKYIPIVNEIRNTLNNIVEDTTSTRRMVVNFQKGHCFQCMQFIVRENTVNVVCMMRSCNAIVNLKKDILITSIYADVFKMLYELSTGVKLYEAHNIKMLIGSLHTFHSGWSV